MIYQQTLAREVSIAGPTVVSDKETTLTIKPGQANLGILFWRTDISRAIPCHPRYLRRGGFVKWTALEDRGASVEVVEHLVAALRGLGIDNALIEMDAPSVPILDGSSLPFVEMIQSAGIVTQRELRKDYFVVREDHEVGVPRTDFRDGGELGELRQVKASSSCHALFVYYGKWEDTPLGGQVAWFSPDEDFFAETIAPARTFMTPWEIERWGPGSDAPVLSEWFCENVLIVSDTEAFEPRLHNEAARHKVLDLFGDLSICGFVKGDIRGYCSGHSLNHKLIERMVKDV